MKTKIIRTNTEAKGGITPEEKIRLDVHTKEWIKNAYRTEPINKEKITEAIKGLYRVSGLEEPRVVIVPSPRIMAFAGSISSLVWAKRSDATDAATYAATRDATYAATYAATDAATFDATYAATFDATYDATDAATDAATYAATYAATRDASIGKILFSIAKTYVSNITLGDLGNYLSKWWNFYQGGNMWPAVPSYLSAFRDILGLKLPIYEKYKFWEMATKEGGFRYMHQKFCIVSDFPEYIKTNSQNQPHCDGGPSHRWRDGWSLWYLNGVKVEQWMAETPKDKLDAKEILKIQNVDQRREVLRRLGVENLVMQLGGKVIDKDFDSKFGKISQYELLQLDLGLEAGPAHFLKMKNPSIDAIHVEGVPRECMTVQEAHNWRRYGDKTKLWNPTELT